MWQNIKSILLGLLLGIILLLSSTVIISFIYEEEVSQYILEELNEYISSEIEVRDVKFSVLKKFPKASLELKNVLAKPKSGYFKMVGDFNTDTLFYAKSFIVEFDISSLFSKKYTINSIDFRDGEIFLFIDRLGDPNYIFWEIKKEQKSESFTIDLNEVRFSNSNVLFYDEKQDITLETLVEELRLKGNLNNKNSTLHIRSSQLIKQLAINNIIYSNNNQLKSDIYIIIENESLLFEKSNLIIDKLKFNLDGSIHVSDNKALYINILANNLRLDILQQNLPENLKNQFPDIVGQKGNVALSLTATSNNIKTEGIHIESSINLTDGQILDKKRNVILHRVSFRGKYSNGQENSLSGSEIQLDDLEIAIGNNSFKGQLFVQNFSDPNLIINTEAQLYLDELKEIFVLDTFDILQGKCTAKINYAGKLDNIKNAHFSDIFTENYDISLNIINGAVKFKDKLITASNISGDLQLKKSLLAENLFFTIEESDFLINGRVSKLFEFLNDQEIFNANASLKSENINLNQLSALFLKEEGENTDMGYQFPDNISFQLKIDVGKFTVGKFSASEIKGNVNYKPRMFSLHEISFNTMDGNAKAGGVIIQKYNNDFIVKSQSRLNQININKLFYTFNNFGQDFIVSDNLNGAISGDVFFASEWNDKIKVYKESVNSESRLMIEDGELIDFKPMEGLSRFIEIDELKHIKFKTIENFISIKNQQVTIPEMDIESSILNLKASGEHLFSKEYSYHIELLLSDLLSKKLKKKKKNSLSAQMMEEDSEDRVKLFLKIEGDAKDSKIRYDRKAARADRKENFNSEKKELKQILNEEFGWFKNDSATVNAKESSVNFETKTDKQNKTENDIKQQDQKFTIEWEESDSIK